MKENKEKIFIFDVCGTLTKTNNTYHFIYWVCKGNIFKLVLFYFYIFGLDVFGLLKIKNQFFRYKIISLLSGYSKKKLEKYADDYIDKLFSTKKVNNLLLRKIERRKKKGNRVILMSASIDLPINALKKRLNVEVYSSSLVYIKGKCTGVLKEDLLFSKKDKINEILKAGDKIYFYSDNYEDKEVFKSGLVNNRIIYHNNKEFVHWKKNIIKAKYFLFEFDNVSDSVEKQYNSEKNFFLYLPTFYYFLTRPAFLSVFLKEILPLSLINCILNGISNFYLNLFLLYLVFFSLYEIGSFYNDVFATRREKRPTFRVCIDLNLNFNIFILIRILFVIILFLLFGFFILKVIILSLLALIILFWHSFLPREKRVISFTCLVLMRSFIPAFCLFNGSFFVFLFLVFVHLWRWFFYIAKINKEKEVTLIYLKYLFFSLLFLLVFILNGAIFILPMVFWIYLINYYIFIQLRFKI